MNDLLGETDRKNDNEEMVIAKKNQIEDLT